MLPTSEASGQLGLRSGSGTAIGTGRDADSGGVEKGARAPGQSEAAAADSDALVSGEA